MVGIILNLGSPRHDNLLYLSSSEMQYNSRSFISLEARIESATKRKMCLEKKRASLFQVFIW